MHSKRIIFILGLLLIPLGVIGVYDEFKSLNKVTAEETEMSEHTIDNEDKVKKAKDELELDTGEVRAIKDDITLPADGDYNTSIQWDSSHPDIITVEGEKGIVNRPIGIDQPVTLEATISKGEVSKTKQFDVHVLRDLEATYPEIEKELDVSEVWSVHQIGLPELLTVGDYQYVAYYNDERELTIAQRELDETEWEFTSFPVKMGWATGSHANITIGADSEGHIHLSSYSRDLIEGPPFIYYKTEEPHDITTFEQHNEMVEEAEEKEVGYPIFLMHPDGDLYYSYRDGGSGDASQIYNRYNVEDESWERWLDEPLFDGGGEMSAYMSDDRPQLGPDGNFHHFFMWRGSPDAATNHTLSYVKSEDLQNWEAADGEPVELPITPDTSETVVDPVDPGDGLLNTLHVVGFDSEENPILSYHKYDEGGNSQIYTARYEDDDWLIVQATDWDYRYEFGGTGALTDEIDFDPVEPSENGTLQQNFWHEEYGEGMLIIDEETLEPIEVLEEEDVIRSWPNELEEPYSTFDHRPMMVEWLEDRGESISDDKEYVLRWERGPRNNDQEVDKPWPEATMLTLFNLNLDPDINMTELVDHLDENGEIKSDEVVRSLETHVTAVNHYENQEETEKVVQHIKGFQDLIDQQFDRELISEGANNVLSIHTDEWISQWE